FQSVPKVTLSAACTGAAAVNASTAESATAWPRSIAFPRKVQESSSAGAAPGRLLTAQRTALERIGGVVVARGRGVARRHQPIDQRLVLGGEAVVERAQVILPVLLGARSADHRGDEAVVEHPGDGELSGGDAALCRMRLDLLREPQRFRPPFG